MFFYFNEDEESDEGQFFFVIMNVCCPLKQTNKKTSLIWHLKTKIVFLFQWRWGIEWGSIFLCYYQYKNVCCPLKQTNKKDKLNLALNDQNCIFISVTMRNRMRVDFSSLSWTWPASKSLCIWRYVKNFFGLKAVEGLGTI